MAHDETEDPGPNTFRRTLIKVLVVQVITLLLLWCVQSYYGGS